MIKKTMTWLIAAWLFSTPAIAQLAFVEGVDFQAITPVVKTSNPDKVVVTELFWYGCPHCFRFEPFIESWAKTLPEGVIFEQVPSVINSSWTEHARMFYTLELMGAKDQVHKKIFDALHLKRQRLNGIDDIARFMAAQGLDEKTFREHFFSFPVDSKLRKNGQIEKRYGHNGVPSVIVNGKYLATGSMAGTYERLIEIINYLIATELQNK